MKPLGRPLILVALTLGWAAAACSGSSAGPVRTTTSDSTRALLLGGWTFIQGCGGLSYQCRAADALGEPTRYVFRSDDSVEAYRATGRLFVVPFSVQPGAVAGTGGDERPTLLIGATAAGAPRPLLVQFQGNGTVLLDEGCCDRFTLQYHRDHSD